jgi:hypothetical protein
MKLYAVRLLPIITDVTVPKCVDELLQQIILNDLPFGGKAFVGLGDFRQVAPMIRSTTPFGPLTPGTNLRPCI